MITYIVTNIITFHVLSFSLKIGDCKFVSTQHMCTILSMLSKRYSWILSKILYTLNLCITLSTWIRTLAMLYVASVSSVLNSDFFPKKEASRLLLFYPLHPLFL